jgi:hypothetical protein
MQASTQMDAENQSQQPQSQKTNLSSQPDPVEAEHVRAVLAHITNNTAAPAQAARKAALVRKPASSKKEAIDLIKNSETMSQKKQQQQPVPAPSKAKAAPALAPTAENKRAVPAPPAALAAVAPSSSRPATRAMEKSVPSRSVKVAAVPTRARDPPRVRAPITKNAPAAAAAKKQQQRSKPQITVAKSPFLRSKQRSATQRQQTKTTEELEMEQVEKAKKEAAALRRRNARSVGPALQGRTAGPARPAPKRPPTEPVREFNLRTAKRQRVHGMETRHQNHGGLSSAMVAGVAAPSPWKSTAQRVAEFTTGVATRQMNQRQRPAPRGRQQQQRGRAELTVPRTPRFATKTRARAPRFKPTEEEDAAKAVAEAQALKIRQKKEADKARNPVLPPAARRRSERRPLTEFKPFSFATDVRATVRSTKPAAELPPFVFGAGSEEMGPVTRSRSHVVTTTAPSSARGAAAAAAPRSSRRKQSLQQHQQQHQDVGHGYQYANVDSDYYNQRPGSGNSNEDGNLKGAAGAGGGGGNAGARGRRRTTAGPMLLGGAVRVLRQEQQEEQQEPSSDDNNNDERYTEEQDGMQAIIRAGATAGSDMKTTLHNPLFHA